MISVSVQAKEELKGNRIYSHCEYISMKEILGSGFGCLVGVFLGMIVIV